ncbi:hypothetical protein R6Q57_022660 [Mikania cordata]
MRAGILLILCTQLMLILLHSHLILSKGLTLQQIQGVERVEANNVAAVQVKHGLRVGKGPYGGANMNREPHTSKSNTPSSHLPSAFWFGCGFFMLRMVPF